MFDFYAAFVDELSKLAGNPFHTFEEWRKHFEETGRKSMEPPKPPKGTKPEEAMPAPGAKPPTTVKKGSIIKRIATHARPLIAL